MALHLLKLNYFQEGADIMFEVKSQSYVVDGVRPITKGLFHYLLEQPYMDHTWALLAYNVLSKYIVDTQSFLTIPNLNDAYSHEKSSNTIRVQCNVFPSIGVEQEIIESTHEFELYREQDKIEEVMFYTVYLNTDFTKDVRNFILKNLVKSLLTGDKKKTVLFAIVPKDKEWQIGLITAEEIIRVLKFAGTGIGIRFDIYQEREDILDLIRDF